MASVNNYDSQIEVLKEWLDHEISVIDGDADSEVEVSSLEKSTDAEATGAFLSEDVAIPLLHIANKEKYDFVDSHNRFVTTFNMKRADYYSENSSSEFEKMKSLLDYQKGIIGGWEEYASGS